MTEKLDMMLAVCKAPCEKCHEEDWLYIPDSDFYGLLCERCMGEMRLGVDIGLTGKNIKKQRENYE